MNILFYLDKYPGFGGIEKVTTQLAGFLSREGHRVVIFSLRQENADELLPLLDTGVKTFMAIDGNNAGKCVAQLRNILLENSITHLVYQDSYAPIDGIVKESIRGMNVKVIVAAHSTPDAFMKAFRHRDRRYSTGYRIRRILFYPLYLLKIRRQISCWHRNMLSWADKYVLLSSSYLPVLGRLTGRGFFHKVSVINNPVTVPIPDSISRQAEKNCLFCARLTSPKGVDRLIDIWEEYEKSGTGWNLTIVGDGPEREYMENEISRRGIKHISMEGYCIAPEKYYAHSSVFLMTSSYEGWSLTLGEAMAYGCVPLVYNSFSAAGEIIQNGENGVLVKPFNKDNFVENLYRLTTDDALLEIMRYNAWQSARKFSMETIGQKWLELLNGK